MNTYKLLVYVPVDYLEKVKAAIFLREAVSKGIMINVAGKP